MKNWELCPKCNGDYNGKVVCQLCKGAMVISAFTGKPPVAVERLSDKTQPSNHGFVFYHTYTVNN